MPPPRLPAAALRRLSLAVLMGVAACGGQARNPFDQTSPAESQLLITLENRGFNDVRVYAVTSRGAQSLGSVSGNTTRRTTLDWRQLDQLSFRIDVLAGRSYRTLSVNVSPGDRVDLTIPDDPSNAMLRVR